MSRNFMLFMAFYWRRAKQLQQNHINTLLGNLTREREPINHFFHKVLIFP